MIDATDLAGMQAAMNDSLPDTCSIVLDALASDGAGGQTATPGAPVSVACRVSPFPLTRRSPDAELIEAGRVTELAPWVITLPAGTVIDVRYRITQGARTFEVVEVLSPRSWEIAARVSCKLINAGAG